MEVAADKERDLFGKILLIERWVMIGRECGGQIEKFADHFQEFVLRFYARESIGPSRRVTAELGREVAKPIWWNRGIHRSVH